MKKIIFFLTASIFVLVANAQNCISYQWAKRAGATNDDYGTSLSIDASGNVFVTGSFVGTAVFGTITLTSVNNDEMFIAKYDAAGNVLWAKQANGTGINFGYSVSSDVSGNAYVTGSFNGTISFGSTTLTPSGNQDIFVTKYDAAGNLLWAKQAGGAGADYGLSASTDVLGNVFVTGYFNTTAYFGSTTLTAINNQDVFVTKYDASGNVLWAKQAGGGSAIYGYGVSSDAAGNAYVTGGFQGTAVFGTTTLTAIGNADVFITKYDATGNVLWAKQARADFGYSISSDASGNVFITGGFVGTATFGTITLAAANSADVFIAKYDAAGNELWAKRAGGTGVDFGTSIKSDASGNVYATGYFSGTAVFGTTTLTTAGNYDIFIAQYDALGNLLWVRRAGGTGYDYGFGISNDASGNVYVTGNFANTVSFGTNTLTSAGSSDIFVAKLNVSTGAVSGTQNTTDCGHYTWHGITYTASGVYAKTFVSTGGCDSLATLNLTINALPTLSITGSGTICVNQTATLSANGATTYTWNTNQNGASINVTPSVNTIYSVQGTDNNGCVGSNSVTVFVNKCLGVEKLEIKNEELKIYPNPVDEVINVELGVMSEKQVEIFVYDILGNIILNKQLAINNGEAQINVSGLSKGIYVLRVSNQNKEILYQQKLLKE